MASLISSYQQEQHPRQYLNLLLSKQGSQGLPYQEEVKSLIQRHLLTLTLEFPSFHVQSASFTHNDGTTHDLLQAMGIIPMAYQGTIFHIPVTIWLVEDYPLTSPLVVVNPSADMLIKYHHKHVDGSGYVSLPYLSNWIYPQSNLSDLTRNLSCLLAGDPPLSPMAASRSNLPTIGRSASPGYGYPSPYDSKPPTLAAHGTRHTRDASEVFRHNATTALVERIKLGISDLQKESKTEIDMLNKRQMQLERRKTRLDEAYEQLLVEREGLEQQLQILGTNTDVVQIWLYNNCTVPTTIQVDDAFGPCDPLSGQMLECMSADNAVEDLLYCLDKAVQHGRIPIDDYLKQVRNLAREQFFLRATCEKVRAAQTHIQLSMIAARYAE